MYLNPNKTTRKHHREVTIWVWLEEKKAVPYSMDNLPSSDNMGSNLNNSQMIREAGGEDTLPSREVKPYSSGEDIPVGTDGLSCGQNWRSAPRRATLLGSDSILTKQPSEHNYLSIETFLQGKECAKQLAAGNIFTHTAILLFILNV